MATLLELYGVATFGELTPEQKRIEVEAALANIARRVNAQTRSALPDKQTSK